MLLDRYRQLLTAYVDGELSSRQRRHVVRLLHRSAEARQLLQQLKADARALRQLSRPPLHADLTDPVLRLIAERNLTPSQHRIVKAASPTVWMGSLTTWAAAAAVLLALGVASYFCFVASLEKTTTTGIAQKQHKSPDAASHVEDRRPTTAQADDKIPNGPNQSPTPKIDPSAAVEPPRVVQKNDEDSEPSSEHKLPLSPKKEAALGGRLETFHLERVPDLLPVIVKLSDLDRLPARKRFIEDLRKDDAFRVELPCPNGAKAFDRVQNAARTQHIGLIVDKTAQERLKSKWKISYAVYLENVTPEELTAFVRQMDTEDRKSAAGKPAEVQLDRLVLTRMNAGHRKELATLLGADPFATVPDTTGPIGSAPRTPLSDTTARQVGQALAGQGGTPRPDSGKAGAQSPQHLALVLTYNPGRPSPGSDEIKHFLDSRKPVRAGNLRIFLVLHSGS